MHTVRPRILLIEFSIKQSIRDINTKYSNLELITHAIDHNGLATFVALVIFIHGARLIVTSTDYLPIVPFSGKKKCVFFHFINKGFLTVAPSSPFCSVSERLENNELLKPVEAPSCVLPHGIVVAYIRPFINCLQCVCQSIISMHCINNFYRHNRDSNR